MHRNPCRKNAIEEGVKLNSASHNQSKKCVRALHEHFQKFNNVTNLDKCISDSDCCTVWKLCPKLAHVKLIQFHRDYFSKMWPVQKVWRGFSHQLAVFNRNFGTPPTSATLPKEGMSGAIHNKNQSISLFINPYHFHWCHLAKQTCCFARPGTCIDAEGYFSHSTSTDDVTASSANEVRGCGLGKSPTDEATVSIIDSFKGTCF